MKLERDTLTIGALLDLYKNGMLRANPEYQRGVVWKSPQKKKLIDSVFRGYPLPLIYLHHIKKTVSGMTREDFEIIDGQQRLTALNEFEQDAYKLFDPIQDETTAKFPIFVRTQPCPWGGQSFGSLSPELRDFFLNTPLAVAKIYTDNANEARDLFIRLQGGLALNSQETRDAWPGNLTDFILSLGGKPEVTRYPGHSFFKRVMRMRPESDRGKTRQLAAQIASLYFARRSANPTQLPDISSGSLDEFYYENIGFDRSSKDCARLISIFDKLDALLGDGKRPKLRGHDAIHLILLVDTLWDEYTRTWEDTLPDAIDKFSAELAKGNASRFDSPPSDYWVRYGQLTRVNSDTGDTIRRRHEFYSERMIEFLQPLKMRDSTRLFGPLEREIIYFRDKKRCAMCSAEVVWNDADIHHVEEHQDGGRTQIENGVLMHRHCHPKGPAAKEFATKWRKRREALSSIEL